MSCFDNTVKNCEGDVMLYTNSNQIYDLVKDYIEIAVHPMFGSLEGPDKGDLFIFDFLNNRFAEDFKMKVSELEQKRPSWKNTVIPFIIQQHQPGGNPLGLFFFDTIWHDVSYDIETDTIHFTKSAYEPSEISRGDILFATQAIVWNSKNAIEELLTPARRAHHISTNVTHRISNQRNNWVFRLPTPCSNYELDVSIENTFVGLFQNIETWKDRFFYAERSDEQKLCDECEEDLKKALYYSDYDEALKWRPNCENSRKQCKYFQSDVFDFEEASVTLKF